MRKLRQEVGMSLGQLTEVTGISKGHLSTIELGFAAITVESLARIAEGLELSPMLFLGFPKKDNYAEFMDLFRQLSITEQKRLQKLVKEWIRAKRKRKRD